MSKTTIDQSFTGAPKPQGSDNHAYAVEEDGEALIRCTFDAAGASEALKSSKRWGITVVNGESRGGVEDCHDFVRGGNLFVEAHTFNRGSARQDVTIKGGFRGAHWVRCPGLRFIVAGDYTKYDARAVYPDGSVKSASPFGFARPPVRDCTVIHQPGAKRVIVLCLHSEPFRGDVINIRVPNFLVAPYFWARATFWKEALAVPEEAFRIDPREL